MNLNSIKRAEEQLISNFLVDNEIYWKLAHKIQDSYFSHNLTIWLGLKGLMSNSGKVNIITLCKEIGDSYFAQISAICQGIDYSVDLESWIDFLADEDKKTKTRQIIEKLNKAICDNQIEKIGETLQIGLESLTSDVIAHTDMIDHVKDNIKHIELIQSGKNVTGFPTGIRVYDNFTGGFHETDLTILAAETSQGKTTFSLNVAYNNSCIGNYVAIFSLEMSLRQLTSRLMAIDSNTSSKDILRGTVNLGELNSKMGKILNNKILLDNTRNSSLESIVGKMRYFLTRYGCKLFFIDYLQLISYHKKGNSTEQNLADICRTLKNFAKENNSSIVLLCQLNRDNASSGVPRLSRLRGSGQIEEAADSVIFIQRPMPSQFGEPEIAKIIQAKGRNSGTGEFDLQFIGQIPTFQNL